MKSKKKVFTTVFLIIIVALVVAAAVIIVINDRNASERAVTGKAVEGEGGNVSISSLSGGTCYTFRTTYDAYEGNLGEGHPTYIVFKTGSTSDAIDVKCSDEFEVEIGQWNWAGFNYQSLGGHEAYSTSTSDKWDTAAWYTDVSGTYIGFRRTIFSYDVRGYLEAGDTNGCAAGDCLPAAVCGNGIIEAGETCDGTNLSGQTCASRGYTSGTLACNSSCGFDTSGCYSVCGNNITESGEQCDDGSNLTILSCGIGACANSVSDSCVSCLNVTCTPGTPGTETCNDIDDDCDGVIDDTELIKQFGTSALDKGYGLSLDGSGNAYIAGVTGGTLPGQTSAGAQDIFVRKYNSAGSEVWTRQFGTASLDEGNSISADSSGNAYVAGYVPAALPNQTSAGGNDAFVRKYNSTGSEVWTRQFGTSSQDFAYGVSADNSGNADVTGRISSGALPGQTSAGGADAFVRKYNSTGSEVWTRQFGTTTEDGGSAVSTDSSGNIYVLGYTVGTLPGQTKLGIVDRDAFVRKYNSTGSEVWTRQFGTIVDDYPFGISTDSSGNIYVAGHTSGTLPGQTNFGGADAFIRKYNSSGTEQWTKQFGTLASDTVGGISTDSPGNVYVGGDTSGAFSGQTNSGGQDAFVRKYNSTGSEVWTRQFGTSANDIGRGVSINSSGSVYLTGETLGTLSGQTSAGYIDAYLHTISFCSAPVCGNNIIEWTETCDGSDLANSGSLRNVISLSGGQYYTCSVFANKTLACWGNNNNGQLGDGTKNNRLLPVSVLNVSNAVQLSAGASHTCVLLSTGEIKCWGFNQYGQLGDNTTTDRNISVFVSGVSGAVNITAGQSHSCAVLSNGTAKCWGWNTRGQLGDGTNISRNTSVFVSGIANAVQISAGYQHTCALLSTGEIKCWGNNNNGQLGNNSTTDSLTPLSVLGITNAVQVYNGVDFTCALLSDGTIKCWGRNDYGQLGNNTNTNKLTPVLVSGISNAVQISCGITDACALLSTGEIKCWGFNVFGEVGDGTNTTRLSPVTVSGITNAVQVNAARYSACAALSNGTAKCWGYNVYGQLGDSTTTARWTPVFVKTSSTCESLGFLGGTLTCNSSCTGLISSGCIDNVCGNSVSEGTEECDDGSNLTILSCGIGACARRVADSCVSCLNVTCTAGTPVTEICGNSIDDDCDGSTDEGCGISGGGSGGGHAPIIVIINDNVFRGGYQNEASSGSEFRFNVAGGAHTLKIINIRADGMKEVKIVISSTPIELTLKVGDKKEVDVNGDGKADMTVELLGINGDLVKLRIKEIVAEVSAPQNMTPFPETPSPATQQPATEKNYSEAFIIAALVVLLGVIISVIVQATRSKKAKK